MPVKFCSLAAKLPRISIQPIEAPISIEQIFSGFLSNRLNDSRVVVLYLFLLSKQQIGGLFGAGFVDHDRAEAELFAVHKHFDQRGIA